VATFASTADLDTLVYQALLALPAVECDGELLNDLGVDLDPFDEGLLVLAEAAGWPLRGRRTLLGNSYLR
jgi:hypothetical protein